MNRIIYFIKAALNNIRQNPVLNLVAAATIFLALVILGAFLLIQVNLQRAVESSTEGLLVSIYLKDGLSDAAAVRIKDEIANLPGITGVTYITKDQALADLKKRLGQQGNILEGLDQNPLPASLEVAMKPGTGQDGRLEALIAKVKSFKDVEDVYYAWEWAEKLKSLVRFVKLSGLVVGAFLFLAIVFIIANTIRLTVMARQDELYILRLMGATETFVRTPFIIEGLLQGLAGALGALFGLYIVFFLLTRYVQLPLGLSLAELVFLTPTMSWFLILSGAGLGFLGSFLSLSKLLKT